jgi:crotonobetainyl-CoA:carnitine CoA-transferase CaiB-like acyl-CoA transferase
MTDPPSSAAGPLAGLRVIDLSTVLAGPYATMLLADLGADVVKVEPPEGDATRGWGPPWVGDERAGTQTAAYYLAVNRNKRSVRLDLRQPPGAEILRLLLTDADVLIENFRPGSLARLGFDDGVLRELNPDLVHLAISGYGPDGPGADRPGYDFVIQAVGGLMSITGDADTDGGHPTKVGVAISDVVAGLFATVGILAGLLARRPEAGVRGQRIDVSLLAATLAVLVNQAQNAFTTGEPPARRGNAHPNIVPYESFATSDGEIVVAVGSERQWPRFCAAIGDAALADDPRFATNGDRVASRAELRPLIADRLATRATAAWLRVLADADIPSGPITDVLAAFESPESRARSRLVEVEHPAFGVLRQAGIPIEFEHTPGAVRTAPPLLGEHTDEVLAELGVPDDEISRLREGGVV